MSDSMLGRGADAAFATLKPCKHGTVLADLCGLCNTTKPDALDDLRDLLKTLHRAATPGECIQAHRILAALKAERRENDERDAKIRELLRRLYDGECPCAAWGESGTLGQAIALLDGGAERRKRAERDAKIRIGILFALHPDTSDKEKHLRKALALLDGDAK